MKNKNSRQIRLQPKCRSLVYGEKVVPELKISGLWLEEQGFYAGQLVDITVQHGELVIKAVAP